MSERRGIRISPEADHVFVSGQTRKGKTTFMRWLVEQLQPVRVIVVDPKGELSFPGVMPCRTPSELEVLLRGRDAPPLVHYIPASFNRDDLERASQIIWETTGPYILWLDDIAELTSPSWCPSGFRMAATQGAQLQKMVIAAAQRLAETHPVFRSQAEHIIVFTPAPIELDLKTLAGHVRREASVLEAELTSLHAEHGNYSHLWYVRDGDELRRCAPLPAAALRGGPRTAATTPEPDQSQLPPCEDSDSASERSSRSA